MSTIAIECVGLTPKRGSDGACGYDLRAADDFIIEARHRTLVKTTSAIALPQGVVGFVCSRSGLALNEGVCVLNAPGVIDSDFRDSIGVILYNTTMKDFRGFKGDRIAQLLLMPHYIVSFISTTKLPETKRGGGAFGSTGMS
jgi:dUTP pyrophosphatase